MSNSNLSVCFSGHRPQKLFKNCTDKKDFFKKLQNAINEQIQELVKKGYTDFYSGMAQGTDLMASELIINLKQKNKDIHHHAVYPFALQSHSYNDYWKNLFMKVLTNSDTNTVLNKDYVKGCYFERNKYLIDNSSVLIAVFDGDYKSGTGQTINYALKKNIEVRIIHISDYSLPVEIITSSQLRFY